MNHIVLNTHTETCERQKENRSLYQFRSKIHLIYHNYKFHLIENCSCLQYALPDCEWIESLLNQAIKVKKIQFYDCQRGYQCHSDFKKSIRSGKIFTDIIHEINYHYYNAAGKEYAIASKIKYIDVISKGNNEITESYEQTKMYLTENNLDYLLPELKDLYFANIIYEPDLTFTDISEFRKHFNKIIKTKS